MSKKVNVNDYIGKKYGNWTIVSYADQYERTTEKRNRSEIRVLIQCKCGKQAKRLLTIVKQYSLDQSCQSCGAKSYLDPFVGEKKGIYTVTNVVFGSITHKDKTKGRQWLYLKCICGFNQKVTRFNWHNSKYKSCPHFKYIFGVIKGEIPEYGVLNGAYRRCTDKNSQDYFSYGRRGLQFEDDWIISKYGAIALKKFIEHIGRRPDKGYELDRIDPELGYIYDNVRWVTKEENLQNSRLSKQNRNKYDIFKIEYVESLKNKIIELEKELKSLKVIEILNLMNLF